MEKSSSRIRRKIALIKIYTFFSYFTSVFYLVFILVWFKLNGISVAEIFAYNLVTIVVGFIFGNILSHVSDKYKNRTIFLMISDFISAMGLLIIIFYVNLVSLLIFAFLAYALSRETFLVALFYDLIERRQFLKGQEADLSQQKAKEFTKFRIFGSIGWAVGAPIAGSLIMMWGFQATFVIPVCLHFFTIVYLFLIKRGLSGGKNLVSLDEGLEPGKKSLEVRHSIFHNREFILLLVVMFIFEIGRSINHSIKTVYAADLGGSYLYIGLLALVWASFEVPLFFLSSKIVENKGYEIPIILGAVFVIVKYLFYIYIITPDQLLLFLLLETLNTFGILWPAITYAINHVFAKENKALGTSLYVTLIAIARFLGNFFGMILSLQYNIGESYEDYHVLFTFGLILDSIALIFFLIILVYKQVKKGDKSEK